jgi:hypothetical protein
LFQTATQSRSKQVEVVRSKRVPVVPNEFLFYLVVILTSMLRGLGVLTLKGILKGLVANSPSRNNQTHWLLSNTPLLEKCLSVVANAVPSQLSYRPRGQRISGGHQILERPVPQCHVGQIPVGATLGDHAECDAYEGTPP